MESDPQATEIDVEETVTPGEPLRPDPGSPQTRGGSMESKSPASDSAATK
jgi:hypothetical protein